MLYKDYRYIIADLIFDAYKYKFFNNIFKAITKNIIEGSYLGKIDKFFGNIKNNNNRIIPLWFFIMLVLFIDFIMTGDREISFELDNIIIDGSVSNMEYKIAKMALFIHKLLLLLNPLFITCICFLFLRSNYYLSFKNILTLMLYGECINYFGVLLSIPITVSSNSIFTFSLANIFLHQGYNPPSILFLLLLKLNIFFVLQIFFVGVGISKMTNSSFKYALNVSFLSISMFSLIMFLIIVLSNF